MKVIIYTLSTCMYCVMAKELLNEKKIFFKEINLEKNSDLFQELKEKFNYSKVPLIFIDDDFIGGYRELNNYINNL